MRYPDLLPQRGGFFFAAFELEHHAFDVSVILVPAQELQAFLRIAPFQDFDRLLDARPRNSSHAGSACRDRSCFVLKAPSRNLPRDRFVPVESRRKTVPAGQRDQSAAALPICGGLETATARFTLRGVFAGRFAVRVTPSRVFHRERLKLGAVGSAAHLALRRIVHRNCARDFIRQRCTRYNFSPVDRRTCSAQFSAESVVIAVLAMVRFGVRIRGRAHMLEVRFRQRRLVCRQWMMGCTAGGKEKKGDERRQQDQRKVTSLSVGQGEPPAGVINSYSQLGKEFLWSSLFKTG